MYSFFIYVSFVLNLIGILFLNRKDIGTYEKYYDNLKWTLQENWYVPRFDIINVNLI